MRPLQPASHPLENHKTVSESSSDRPSLDSSTSSREGLPHNFHHQGSNGEEASTTAEAGSTSGLDSSDRSDREMREHRELMMLEEFSRRLRGMADAQSGATVGEKSCDPGRDEFVSNPRLNEVRPQNGQNQSVDRCVPPTESAAAKEGSQTASNYASTQQNSLDTQLFVMKTVTSPKMFEMYPCLINDDGTPNRIIECMKLFSSSSELLIQSGFDTYEEAVLGAIEAMANRKEWSGFKEKFPPWTMESSSGKLVIKIITYEQFTSLIIKQAEAQTYLQEKMACYHNVLSIEEGRMRIITSNFGAYYSYPKQFYDLRADMEIVETNDWRSDNLKKVRPDACNMTSLMYRGHRMGSMGRFASALASGKEYVEKEVGLLRHLDCVQDLEELFLEMDVDKKEGVKRAKVERRDNCLPVTQSFICAIAPWLWNLKVLSFGPGFTLFPQALVEIGHALVALERLDISHALSAEFSFEPSATGERQRSEDDECMYYEFALPKCVANLGSLVRLDIGDKIRPNSESNIEGDVVISEVAMNCIQAILQSRGGYLTESSSTFPPEWPKAYSEGNRGRIQAVQNVISNSRMDPDLRNIAFKELQMLIVANSDRTRVEAANVKPVVINKEVSIDKENALVSLRPISKELTDGVTTNKRCCEEPISESSNKVPGLPSPPQQDVAHI